MVEGDMDAASAPAPSTDHLTWWQFDPETTSQQTPA